VSKQGRRTRVVTQPSRKTRRTSLERSSGALIIGTCSVIALAIIIAAAWGPVANKIRLSVYGGQALADVGSSPSGAACQAIYTIPVTGSPASTSATVGSYDTAPPAFGAYAADTSGTAVVQFDTTADAPSLPALLGFLNDGYTVVWYDSSIKGAKLTQLQAIANKLSDANDSRDRLVVVPWTKAYAAQVTNTDASLASFPSGTHVAFTHWSAGGIGVTDTTKQVGAFQYCGGVSGAALKQFMELYPSLDSPSPSTTPEQPAS
jgi:hypothetical protein